MQAIKSCSPLLLSLGLALVVAASASATTSYGTYNGPQISYTLIQETAQAPLFGPPDSEPLFGAPIGSGNNLIFQSSTFAASAGGPSLPTADETHSLLGLAFESNNDLVDAIEIINLTEFGDYTLNTFPPTFPPVGTAASIFLQMTGTLTITEVSDGTTTYGVSETFGIAGTFSLGTPAGTGATFFTIATNPGAGNWSATYSIDVSAMLPTKGVFYADKFATAATIQLNNKLQAFGTAGETAAVQKKTSGPSLIVEVIPEPATGALLVVGLITLGIRSRRRRV